PPCGRGPRGWGRQMTASGVGRDSGWERGPPEEWAVPRVDAGTESGRRSRRPGARGRSLRQRRAEDVVGDVVEDVVLVDDAALREPGVEDAAAPAGAVLVGVGDVVVDEDLDVLGLVEDDEALAGDVDPAAVAGGAVLPHLHAHAGAEPDRRGTLGGDEVDAGARRRLVADDPGVADDELAAVVHAAPAAYARGAVVHHPRLVDGQRAADVRDAARQARLVGQHLVLLDEDVVGLEGPGVVDAADALGHVAEDVRVLDVGRALVGQAALEAVGAGLDEPAERAQAAQVPDPRGLVVDDVRVEVGPGAGVDVDDRRAAVPAPAVAGEGAFPVLEVAVDEVDGRSGEGAVVGAHDVP